MIKFKYLLLITFSLLMLSCTNYDYRDGYSFIKNAEKAVKQNDLALAESYLEKASKSDYGFCGNSWVEARTKIDLLKVQILHKKGKYKEVLQLLDTMTGCKSNTLKIETLFLMHGKDKVVQAFQATPEVKKHVNEYGLISYSIYIEELAYTFTFNESFPDYKLDENDEVIIPKIDYNNFVSIAKACDFYALIEN